MSMTREEAVTYGNELIQCSTGLLREFAELATRALRQPASGAEEYAMAIEAAAAVDSRIVKVLAAHHRASRARADYLAALPTREVPE